MAVGCLFSTADVKFILDRLGDWTDPPDNVYGFFCVEDLSIMNATVRLATRPFPAIASGLCLLPVLLLSPAVARAMTFDDVYNAALGGDMVRALALLDSLDASRWTAKDSAAAACLRRTFAEPPLEEDLPPISKRLLTAYREYWQTAMLRRALVKDAEAKLLADLNTILGPVVSGSPDPADLDSASERAKAAIKGEGLFALTGVTSPYYELMLWRTQTLNRYRVELPGGLIDVHVVFLEDFASLGWAGYATCGRSHSGGWATQESLYAVKSAYDLGSESFRVSYLTHEGQHFSDYKGYSKLKQPELEYRAKLTEITMSDSTTHALVAGFARRTGTDRSVPHSFANLCVTRDLSRELFETEAIVTEPSRWRAVTTKRIRAAAARLLRKSAELLRKLGAGTTEEFLVAG